MQKFKRSFAANQWTAIMYVREQPLMIFDHMGTCNMYPAKIYNDFYDTD